MGTNSTDWRLTPHWETNVSTANEYELREHKGIVYHTRPVTNVEYRALMKEAVGQSRSAVFDDKADDIRPGFKQMPDDDKDALFLHAKHLRIESQGNVP